MTSAKQIKANQQNAQHSKGPTSETGRQKAALNSVSHGLTARSVILAEHEAEPYRVLTENICAEMSPAGYYEVMLVTSIIDARWRLHQIAGMEAAIYALGFRNHAHELADLDVEHAAAMCRVITFEEKRKELDRLHRYESRLMRQIAKETAIFLQTQTARKLQEAKDREAVPDFSDPEEAAEADKNGFVLSNADFASQPIAQTSPSAMP